MNEGIKKGIIFSIILIVLQFVLLLINDWEPKAQFILWLLQLIFYFIAGLVASEAEYNHCQDFEEENLERCVASGRGAAMTISILLWLYIIIRSILLDDAGLFNHFGVIGTLLFAILDVILSMGIGTFAGKSTKKKYSVYQ